MTSIYNKKEMKKEKSKRKKVMASNYDQKEVKKEERKRKQNTITRIKTRNNKFTSVRIKN